jgi:hypothetical protein
LHASLFRPLKRTEPRRRWLGPVKDAEIQDSRRPVGPNFLGEYSFFRRSMIEGCLKSTT